ncbi:hypothetical protein ACIBN5_36675, partial [Streptomyces sp. NPDC050255]
KEEFERLDARSGQPAAVAEFTVVSAPSEELIAGRVSALTHETAQQLALLGPPQWDSMTAVFSCTVSAETAELSFWDRDRPMDARVPEQIALLVRRQRHLAAAMPAGPWLRLLLTVTKAVDGRAQVSTQYDYGDERLPDGQLLAPSHYRNDLVAYPRTEAPNWLTGYAGARGARGSRAERLGPAPARVERPRPEPAQRPFVDCKPSWSTRLVADRHRITYGRHMLDWDEVDWVRYPVLRTKHQGFLFPSTYTTTYTFGVGRYVDSPKGLANLIWDRSGKRPTDPAEWLALVDFVQRIIEPRLLTDHLALIRQGGSFSIGEVRVHRDGLTLRGVMEATWRSLTGVEVASGLVWIHEQGRPQPVRVSLDSPNAVLLPRIVTAMTG